MDWNALKTLTLIAKSGSMAGAAKALEVNYSTIFRRVESLEKEVGGSLFERGSKGYVATPLAKEVLTFANLMHENAEQIERSIVGRERLPNGTVKVTAPFNISNRYLPEALKSISKEYPGISYEILSSNDLFNLNSRIADIAIRATRSPPEHLIGRKATSIPWALFASEQFLREYSETPTIETLANYPLIGATGDMLNLPAFTWLEKHYSNSIVARCDELTAMSHFATGGHGVAFLPIDQRRAGLTELIEFPQGKISDLWVLTHPDLRKTERVRIVAEHLYRYFNELTFE